MTHPPFRFGPALLFCPADRPDRFAKAAERADAVILDLEDAVADDAKHAARLALVAIDARPRARDRAREPRVDAPTSPTTSRPSRRRSTAR